MRLKPYCTLCGHIFSQYECRQDHILWCARRYP